MAITIRKGAYADFVESSLQPGEFADVVADDPNTSDGKALYICLASGNVVRIATDADIDALLTTVDLNLATWSGNLATGYSPSSGYSVGDIVTHNNVLYRCTTEIAAGGEVWTAGHWTQVSLTDIIPAVDDTLTHTGQSADAKVVGDFFDQCFSLSSDEAETIPDNAYLNSYLTRGTYKVTSTAHAGTMHNMPVSIAGRLVVIETSQATRVMQLFFGSGSAAPIYARYYNGSIWSDWGSFAKTNAVTQLRSDLEGAMTQLGTDMETADNNIIASLAKYFLLSADETPTIPDNSDFNSYTTAGTYKVTNATHAGTMHNMPPNLSIAGKLIVLQLSQAARITQLFFGAASAAPVYIRFYNGSEWSNWRSFAKTDTVNSLEARVEELERSMKIIYSAGSYESGLATERLLIYVPATDGYLMYKMYHFVNNEKNADVWQIFHVYHVDDSLENEVDLTVTGEWECALHLDATRSDFSGGNTHGDEIMSSCVFLLDGLPVTISSYTTLTNCDRLEIIRTSKMYDPLDSVTEIVDHGVKYTFAEGILIIEQSVKWLVAETLQNCFMAMFLPLKTKLDRAVVNSDFNVLTLPSTTSEHLTSIVKPKASSITMWDTDGGLSARISVPSYPTGLTEGDRITISDNNGKAYNKVYFKVCGSGTSTIGELWKSVTKYELNYA